MDDCDHMSSKAPHFSKAFCTSSVMRSPGRISRLSIQASRALRSALSPGQSDLDKNGEISLLEAFDYARDRTVRFYEEAKRLRPEHPLLDDNGDGLGSETPTSETADGRMAGRTYLTTRRANVAAGDPASMSPLQKEKAALLEQIEGFKARKSSMPENEYRQKLEELFIRLAKVNREMKSQKP